MNLNINNQLIETNQFGLLINYSVMNEISTMKVNLSVFSLVRIKKDCFYPPITADYTPLKSPNQTVQQIAPKFNADHKFFTAAFINPYHQNRLKMSADEVIERERENFMRKVNACEESIDDETPYFSPRDNNYCSICQTSFQSYWQHIESRVHGRQIKQSKYTSYISDLCRRSRNDQNQQKKQQYEESSVKKRKKKISKNGGMVKRYKQEEVYRREDFIVKLPKDLFSKDGQNIIYNNMSTNTYNDGEQLIGQ